MAQIAVQNGTARWRYAEALKRTTRSYSDTGYGARFRLVGLPVSSGGNTPSAVQLGRRTGITFLLPVCLG
jgi:hypothetical protein